MIVKSISYGRTKNLGNYESERLDMTAEVEDGDDPQEVMAMLQSMVNGELYPPTQTPVDSGGTAEPPF